MTDSEPPTPGFELERPRNLATLLTDSLVLYRRHLGVFLAISFVVVVPVSAIVLGVGLGQFSGGYDSTPAQAAGVVQILMTVLVTDPLVAVMVLYVLQRVGAGERVSVGAAIQAGLDAFARVFWPVLIAVLCEAATLVTVVVWVVLLVRWFFVPQVVVVEGARGTAALRASWNLTRGFSLRTAALLVVARVLFSVAGGLVVTPVAALARSADSNALELAATVLGYMLVVAPLGLFAGLLFYDLRSRQRALAR